MGSANVHLLACPDAAGQRSHAGLGFDLPSVGGLPEIFVQSVPNPPGSNCTYEKPPQDVDSPTSKTAWNIPPQLQGIQMSILARKMNPESLGPALPTARKELRKDNREPQALGSS